MQVYTNIKTGAQIKAGAPTTEGVNRPVVHYRKMRKNGEWTKGSWMMAVEVLNKSWKAGAQL